MQNIALIFKWLNDHLVSLQGLKLRKSKNKPLILLPDVTSFLKSKSSFHYVYFLKPFWQINENLLQSNNKTHLQQRN